MISPTGSASPPRMPTVSSRPAMNCSIITSSSCSNASATAARSAACFTIESPTVEPCLDGFTITGHPSVRSTLDALGGAAWSVAIIQFAVPTVYARKRCFERSLSIASALGRCPLPVYGTPARSSSAWIVPSSPRPPCSARKATSQSPRFGRRAAVSASDSAFIRANSSGVGGSCFTTRSESIRCSSAWESSPFAVSIARTVCPRDRSASAILSPDARETSRSDEVPPISTVIRTGQSIGWFTYRSARTRSSRHQIREHVAPRHDSLDRPGPAHEHGRSGLGKQLLDRLHVLCGIDDGKRVVHHFADHRVEEPRALEPALRQRVLRHAADAFTALQHRQLRHVVQPHQPERLAHELAGRGTDERRGCTVALVRQQVAERHSIGLEELVLAHPLVVEHLRQVALARIAQEGHDERLRVVRLARHLERHVRDQPRRASHEQAFLAREPPRHRERVAIVHRAIVVHE